MATASTPAALLKAIQSQPPGWAFSACDFAEIGSRSAIDVTLHRMAAAGTIRRVMRGVYDHPRYSDVLEDHVPPDIGRVAAALARKFAWTIQPTGDAALNQLGLSTQVPAQAVFLSDGPRRSYTIGKTCLQFKPATLKEARYETPESGLLVHALKALGPQHIHQHVITTMAKTLTPELAERVLMETRNATGWVYDAIRQICQGVLHG